MNEIEKMEDIGEIEQVGQIEKLKVKVEVEVREGSFLHIGGSPTPLWEKKASVFMIGDQPAIPASSFKGAFRNSVENHIIKHKEELKEIFGVEDAKYLKPCIPASRPTAAEKSLLDVYKEKNCEITVDEKEINIPRGICPVCYLFGANGIMGFLRVPNFLPVTKGVNRLEQTQIGIDRRTRTQRYGAIVHGDQVLPGTRFEGELEILLNDGNFEFGRPRKMRERDKETILDEWLKNTETEDLDEVRVKIINNLILKPLEQIDRLGGQKSKGAGRIKITDSRGKH
jgi:CRISPR/Cas system CSM-associated protein Csm3 (group 7 of RAMP superfamily)